MARYYSSSASSSDCDCGQYWPNYDTGYGMNYTKPYGSNHPFYPTMGHPLVYYAQTPQSKNLKHRGRDRQRGSPNCFIKAFRWYTREHVPYRNVSPPKQDISGFAAWLDVKYDQFLEESQAGSESYRIKLRQTFEAEKAPNTNSCEPCAAKQGRRRSPWKRKRRSKSSDAGNELQKPNQSCEYILQPKDVSRVPSVCCHPSNATTLTSVCDKKSLCKSHSTSNMTMIIKYKETSDATPAQGDKPKGDVCLRNSCKFANSRQSVTCGKAQGNVCSNNIDKNAETRQLVTCDQANGDVCLNNICKYTSSKQSVTGEKTQGNACSNTYKYAENKQFIASDKAQGNGCQTNAYKYFASRQAVEKQTSNVCLNKTGSKVSLSEKVEVSTMNKKANVTKDFGCQHGEEKVPKRNAETQYDVAPQNEGRRFVPSFHSEKVTCECPWLDKNNEKVLVSSRVTQDTNINTREPIAPCDFNTAHERASKSVETMAQKSLSRQQSLGKFFKTRKNVDCQCPEQNVTNVDAQTQYQTRPATAGICNNNTNICECDFMGSIQYNETPVQSVSVPSTQCCPCEAKIREELVAHRMCLKFAETTSQTSSHPICLEKETVRDYPLFLKIVCADKLSNEKFK